MNIVMVNDKAFSGGAGRAGYRLFQNMKKNFDLNVKMLVRKKDINDYDITSILENNIKKYEHKVKFLLSKNLQRFHLKPKIPKYSIGKFGLRIDKEDIVQNSDLIHLHWINNNFMSLNSLKKLQGLKKPIVWTLHDMWPFTGGCHYSYNCEKYENKCGLCKFVKKMKEKDISRINIIKKKKIFDELNLTIVTCSNWLRKCAKSSFVLKNKNIMTIHNTINSNIYKPFNKKSAKNILNLPLNKKIISFGAMTPFTEKRKGFDYLLKVINLLEKKYNRDDIEFLIFGDKHKNDIIKTKFKVNYTGYLRDDYSLSLVYNASDLFLFPSLEDNLPNMVLESLACGVPVIGFDIGGIPDMVEHKINGYLAKYKSIKDLFNGIEWYFSIQNKKKIKLNARKIVLKKFNQQLIGNKYYNLYQDLIT